MTDQDSGGTTRAAQIQASAERLLDSLDTVSSKFGDVGKSLEEKAKELRSARIADFKNLGIGSGAAAIGALGVFAGARTGTTSFFQAGNTMFSTGLGLIGASVDAGDQRKIGALREEAQIEDLAIKRHAGETRNYCQGAGGKSIPSSWKS